MSIKITAQESIRWYVASTGNHQGLVIDETTGANIAVTYDKKNAQLIAAAPALLEKLREVLDGIDRVHDNDWTTDDCEGFDGYYEARALLYELEENV
jgi:myo-inositol-hexaphosphate 3-phosphohydrolase